MLISHNLKILYFRNIGLKVDEEEVEEANQIAEESAEDRPTIAEIVKKVEKLNEESKAELHYHIKNEAEHKKYSPSAPKK